MASERLRILIYFVTFLAALGGSALVGSRSKDFLYLYHAAALARAGDNPYAPALYDATFAPLAASVGEPDIETTGFFYPPQALLVLKPLAHCSWPVARHLWTLLLLLAGLSCGALGSTFGARGNPALIVALLLLNPLTLGCIANGQTALLVCAAVAVGQWFHERGRPVLGAILWSFAAIKPSIGLSLIVLAGFLGGMRRLLATGLAVVALNLAGIFLALAHPVDAWTYSAALAHWSTLPWNSVKSDQIVSWNRLLLACGGPAIELTPTLMLWSYALFLAILCIRWLTRGRPRPSPAYSLALATVAGLFCPPAHGYDLVLLVLLAPYVSRLVAQQRWSSIGLLSVLYGLASIPRTLVRSLAHSLPGSWIPLMSYRSLVVAALLLYLLLSREDPERPA